MRILCGTIALNCWFGFCISVELLRLWRHDRNTSSCCTWIALLDLDACVHRGRRSWKSWPSLFGQRRRLCSRSRRSGKRLRCRVFICYVYNFEKWETMDVLADIVDHLIVSKNPCRDASAGIAGQSDKPGVLPLCPSWKYLISYLGIISSRSLVQFTLGLQWRVMSIDNNYLALQRECHQSYEVGCLLSKYSTQLSRFGSISVPDTEVTKSLLSDRDFGQCDIM